MTDEEFIETGCDCPCWYAVTGDMSTNEIKDEAPEAFEIVSIVCQVVPLEGVAMSWDEKTEAVLDLVRDQRLEVQMMLSDETIDVRWRYQKDVGWQTAHIQYGETIQ